MSETGANIVMTERRVVGGGLQFIVYRFVIIVRNPLRKTPEMAQWLFL